MYFVCTLQPDLVETQRVGYIGEWLTKDEKKEAILKFYRQKQQIPLSINHTAAKEYGSLIPQKERIGRVIDLFNDKDGDLIAKCVIDKGNAAIRHLNEGVYTRKEKWGVSVRIDWVMIGGTAGGHVDKTLTHVALTQTPYLADEGTYIHHWAVKEETVDKAIHREYFREGIGHCFAAPELIHKIKNVVGSGYSAAMSNEVSQVTTDVPSSQYIQPQSQPQSQSSPQQESSSNKGQGLGLGLGQGLGQTNSTPNPASTRLVDLEGELQEMETLIPEGMPLQKMPAPFRTRYLGKMDQIEAKKKEIETHVNYLIENKLLNKEDARPLLGGLGSTDLESKRPIYGCLEASFEDRVRTIATTNLKMKELEENNKRSLAEKDKAVHELENMKKRIRLNDYSAPITPQHQRYDDFGSSVMSPPLQKETVSLIRMDEKSSSSTTEAIHDANLRAMFNYDIDRQTTVSGDQGKEHYSRLVKFMSSW